MLTKIIPAYLYQEYNDDPDLQALIDAWNAMAQEYVDWFNQVGLPIYTGQNSLVFGPLLDWVAAGLYGFNRPVLPFGLTSTDGLFNSLLFNEIPFNQSNVSSADSFVTNDDTFRRVITWHFFKGDGKQFTIRWLKRRIARFLFGANGINFNVDQTYDVSVTFGIGDQVIIEIPTSLDYAAIFKAAADSGVLELPFQHTWVVNLI
jgi:hypothetical protein